MEETVGYLCKAAASLESKKHAVLKSFYFIKCHKITRGYGLPQKQFSTEIRCSHCFIDWTIGMFNSRVIPLKLTKRQRKKIRSTKEPEKMILLNSNQLERKCLFCNKITLIRCSKVIKSIKEATEKTEEIKVDNYRTGYKHKINLNIKNNTTIDVYSQTRDIFSLQNQNNNINSRKVKPKVIQNNKKKKDKFAGLCQAAVLASAKIKKERQEAASNKLNLFLKPSK